MTVKVGDTKRKKFVVQPASAETINSPRQFVKTTSSRDKYSSQDIRNAIITHGDILGVTIKESSGHRYTIHQRLMKNWANTYSPTCGCGSPMAFLELVLKEWRSICSGLRAQGMRAPFLMRPYEFDTTTFFERPEYRKLIVGYLETRHLLTKEDVSREKFFDDLQNKPFQKEETFTPSTVDKDAREEMRKRMFG